jgi:hypothetical protein
MSGTSKKKARRKSDELRAEYRFDYSKARPNRFASRMGESTVAVVLEPDVAEVFGTSTSVNRLLRSVIAALPSRRGRVRVTRRKAG